MGNGMNKVMPGLFIGNFRDAKDAEQLEKNDITHIIAVHDEAKPHFQHISYKCIELSDSPTSSLIDHFKESIRFIHNARKNNGNVLVHCIAGVSRSATICACYLIIVGSLHWEDSIQVIRYARSVINPNYGFQKQLQTFDLLDSEKFRTVLIEEYGELDASDKIYLESVLKKIGEENQSESTPTEQAEQMLGTTSTFGHYERKKQN